MAVEKNDELKKMVAQLAKVINNTLSNSKEVRQMIESIRENGYGVDISLAACIGIYKEENTNDKSATEETCTQEIKFAFDKKDLEFLKSINLRVSEE